MDGGMGPFPPLSDPLSQCNTVNKNIAITPATFDQEPTSNESLRRSVSHNSLARMASSSGGAKRSVNHHQGPPGPTTATTVGGGGPPCPPPIGPMSLFDSYPFMTPGGVPGHPAYQHHARIPPYGSTPGKKIAFYGVGLLTLNRFRFQTSPN